MVGGVGGDQIPFGIGMGCCKGHHLLAESQLPAETGQIGLLLSASPVQVDLKRWCPIMYAHEGVALLSLVLLMQQRRIRQWLTGCSKLL